MRRFALAVLCVTPLLPACGDNIVPAGPADTAGDDGSAAVDTTIESGEPGDSGQSGQPADDHGTPRAIKAALDINSPSCDAATASFEVLPRHVDDSTFVANARCRVAFDDGAVSDLCVGEHTFASAGAHTFTAEVEDRDSGATARVELTRDVAVPLMIELAVDAPECGLEVAFSTKLTTPALVHVTMSPVEKVVEPDVTGMTGSFQALEPGTYTIMVSAEDERATGPICVREVSQTVTLTACSPPCDQ